MDAAIFVVSSPGIWPSTVLFIVVLNMVQRIEQVEVVFPRFQAVVCAWVVPIRVCVIHVRPVVEVMHQAQVVGVCSLFCDSGVWIVEIGIVLGIPNVTITLLVPGPEPGLEDTWVIDVSVFLPTDSMDKIVRSLFCLVCHY